MEPISSGDPWGQQWRGYLLVETISSGDPWGPTMERLPVGGTYL